MNFGQTCTLESNLNVYFMKTYCDHEGLGKIVNQIRNTYLTVITKINKISNNHIMEY